MTLHPAPSPAFTPAQSLSDVGRIADQLAELMEREVTYARQ